MAATETAKEKKLAAYGINNDKLYRALEIMFFITLIAISGRISLRDIALGILFIIFLARKIIRRDFTLVSTEFNRYIFLFFLFSLLSLFKAEDLIQASHAIVTPVFTYIVFYFMALEIIERKKIDKYIKYLYIGHILFLLYGLYIDVFTSDRFFLSGNSRGTFAGFIIIISLSLIITNRGKIYHKIIYIIGFSLSLFALFSHSRGAIVGFTIGIVFWVILINLKNFSWKKAISTLIVLLIIFSAFYSSEAIVNRFDRALDYQDDSSVTTRFRMWRTSFNLIKENPVLGIGAGNFTPTAHRYVDEVMDERAWSSGHQHPHNLYFQIPLEQGIISLVIFAILIYKAYYIAFKNYLFFKEKSWPYFAAIAQLAMLTAILGHSFFDFPLNRTFNGVPLIVLIVLNLKYYNYTKVQE